MDAYREESTLLGVMLKGLVPDKELVQRLEDSRAQVEEFARDAEIQVNQRLRDAQSSGSATIDALIETLQADIKVKEGRRLSSMRKAVALMTGAGLAEDLKNEVDIQLSKAELEALNRIKGEFEALRTEVRDAATDFEDKRVKTLRTNAAYLNKKEEILRFERDSSNWNSGAGHQHEHSACGIDAATQSTRTRVQLCGRAVLRSQGPTHEGEGALSCGSRAGAIGQHCDPGSARRTHSNKEGGGGGDGKAGREGAAVHSARLPQGVRNPGRGDTGADRYQGLLVLVRRAVGREAAARSSATGGRGDGRCGRIRRNRTCPDKKISAVSQEIVLSAREELLVHPEYLQSSADQGHKRTQWLLSWKFWLTSLAAQMVALDRIRDADGETFVISSKNDAFAEVGVIDLPEGAAFVLQPRNLVGVVQSIDRPIKISRKWNWSLMAFITLQFRYLIFDGPGKLLVQGCRGVRIEQAGSGRSIDQAATFGFSANLDYSPRRSETFGAYLLGTRSLFNDRFTGGPGVLRLRGNAVLRQEVRADRARVRGADGWGAEGVWDLKGALHWYA